MRSPASLGLGSGLPFVKASDSVGAYVAVTNAVLRQSQFQKNGMQVWEVVFSFRLLADQFTADGEAVPEFFRVSLEANDARAEYVEAFKLDREEVGPFVIVQLASRVVGQSGPIVFNDASDLLDGEVISPEPATLPKALGVSQQPPAAYQGNGGRGDTSNRQQTAQQPSARPYGVPHARATRPASPRSAPPVGTAPRGTEEPPAGWPDDFDFGTPDPVDG